MIRSAVQCLRRSYCACKRPLQLLKHPSHQTVVAEVPAYTFERRYCCTRASYSNWRAPLCIIGVQQQRELHCSSLSRGLEEFFPKTDDIIEEGERTGRAWLTRELRHKSSEDLHKLWYILLKERNMLLTLRHDANRAGFIMPAPERMKKVRKSMARIKVVIAERGKAIKEAEKILRRREKQKELANIQSQADSAQNIACEEKQVSQ